MQTNEAVIVIVAIGTFIVLWTTSIIAGIMWLNAQFSRNRAATYDSAKKLERQFAAEMQRHDRRIRALEFWRVSREGVLTPDGSQGQAAIEYMDRMEHDDDDSGPKF